ncbi:Nucleotidylyl transferase [Leucogyrophana mollusca]|uniref:Nucleotidylyl transferase n=1 Tax=Leucogyrophana mollusca TaxID=85980 RepID=A0ACB8BJE7_9AGAM|nr:Nucleotidylyl transferase [Leucogyrophana mollusca]
MIPSRSLLPVSFTSNALNLLHRVQQGASRVELVYTSHDQWPYPPIRRQSQAETQPALRISILDSSFNPPTLAHLALANAPLPRYATSPASTFVDPNDDYDAKMLLLSVRNADKSLKPGDATHVQRLEMMYLLSRYMSNPSGSGPGSHGADSDSGNPNVAIAIIDEPTFVGKSSSLLHFLQTRLSSLRSPPYTTADTPPILSPTNAYPPCQLTFLLGMDTLARLISPRYYQSEDAMTCALRTFFSPEAEGCRVVCARRTSSDIDAEAQREVERKILTAAREFVETERVTMIDIGETVQAFSSSEVRAKIGAGDDTWKRLVTPTLADYVVEKQLYQVLTPT